MLYPSHVSQRRSTHPRASYAAFTLIELLVVISIIALMIGILLPALGAARESGKHITCLSNLRQLGVAQHSYANEQDGRYLLVDFDNSGPGVEWPDRIRSYVGGQELICSAVDEADLAEGRRIFGQSLSYGINPSLNMPQWEGLRDATGATSEMILMGDKTLSAEEWLTAENEEGDGYYFRRTTNYFSNPQTQNYFWIRQLDHKPEQTHRHGPHEAANMVMLDGHAKALESKELYRDSGRWYFGDSDYQQVQFNTRCCP